jgi:hypothetical protein
MACHHIISVAANAGDEKPMATVTAASCINLMMGCTANHSQIGCGRIWTVNISAPFTKSFESIPEKTGPARH